MPTKNGTPRRTNRCLRKPKAKNIDCLWKVCRRVWKTITPEIVSNVFKDWKLRCRKITKANGHNIENVLNLYNKRIH